MMENELLDVFGRKTKAVGGYMTYIPDYKSPFIFANFNGTSDDVNVITHECWAVLFRGIWHQRTPYSGSMLISVWRLQRSIPCQWSFSRSPGIL